MEMNNNIITITDYKTEDSNIFENVSDEKTKLIYGILNDQDIWLDENICKSGIIHIKNDIII